MGTAVFTVNIDGSNYDGTCAQAGNPLNPSGTAKIDSKISLKSKAGKVLFDIIVNRKFFEKTSSAASELGLSSTGWTYDYLVECVCQISQQGKTAWLDYWDGMPGEPTARAVVSWYRSYDVSSVDANGFEIFACTENSGAQNFVFWRYAPTGKLKLKKISANTAITG